jgi:glutathione S-transferase
MNGRRRHARQPTGIGALGQFTCFPRVSEQAAERPVRSVDRLGDEAVKLRIGDRIGSGAEPAPKFDDGTVLTENSAILQYIAEQYPEAQLAPPASDRVGRAKLRQWLSFISSELHKGLMTPLLGEKTPPEVKAWTVNKYAPRLAYLDERLKGREFLLDRFSVADGYLTVVLNWTRATPQIDLAAYPNVKAYLERMRARPSIAAALATEIPLFQAEVARRKAA